MVIGLELEVCGLVRTRRFPLDEIDRAYVGAGSNAVQPTRTLHLVMRDGTDVALQEISTSGLFGSRANVEEFVDALNTYVESGGS